MNITSVNPFSQPQFITGQESPLELQWQIDLAKRKFVDKYFWWFQSYFEQNYWTCLGSSFYRVPIRSFSLSFLAVNREANWRWQFGLWKHVIFYFFTLYTIDCENNPQINWELLVLYMAVDCVWAHAAVVHIDRRCWFYVPLCCRIILLTKKWKHLTVKQLIFLYCQNSYKRCSWRWIRRV